MPSRRSARGVRCRKKRKNKPLNVYHMPIDIDAWNAAKWSATFFAFQDGRPPILGLGFRNRFAARHIFEEWHERYGDRDEYEEIRVSIVEWDIKGQEPGYSVHIGSDPKTAIERFKAAGFPFDDDILMCVSRMNRMTTPNGMQNVVNFKASFRRHKTYYLTPGQISEDCKKLEPIFDLSILKSKIHFRLASEIERHDEDWVVVNPDRD